MNSQKASSGAFFFSHHPCLNLHSFCTQDAKPVCKPRFATAILPMKNALKSLSSVRQFWCFLSQLMNTDHPQNERDSPHQDVGGGVEMTDKINESQLYTKTAVLSLLCVIIRRELARTDTSNSITATLPHCPRCGNPNATKRGRDSTGKQRYQCGKCKRSYTTATGSEFSSTNLPLETWMAYAECYVNRESLRIAAKHCGVSLKTAFRMRKRLSQTISRYSLQVKKALDHEHD